MVYLELTMVYLEFYLVIMVKTPMFPQARCFSWLVALFHRPSRVATSAGVLGVDGSVAFRHRRHRVSDAEA